MALRDTGNGGHDSVSQPAAAAAQAGRFKQLTLVWKHRNYAFFMGGMTPHLLTLWMQRVGIGWLAWELTASPTWLGVIAAADFLPMLVLAPFAGAVTDRMDTMKLLKLTQMLIVLHSFALPFFMYAGLMTIELLFVLSLVLGAIHPFASTARHAVVPATVPRNLFATAIALDSAIFQASRFVGPAIAAIIIPLAGVQGTFLANTVGNMLFLGGIYGMRMEPPARKGQRGNILVDIKESFAYVRDHRGIFALFLILVVASLFVRPLQDMLPGFSGDVFQSGAVGLAWLTSGMGVGAMVSATWIAMRGALTGLTTIVVTGVLGIGVTTIGFVATDILWVGVLFAALSGFTLNTMSTSIQALVQSAVTDEMRGRVMSLYILIFRGMPAFGALLFGLLAEGFGLRLTFLAAGICCIAGWLVALPHRRRIAAALE